MDTNQETGVPASPEDRLAAMFGEEREQADPPEPEPVEEEPEEAATAPDEESTEAEPTDEGEEDDGEEVEFEGVQYRLPKPLKEALLRQKDYTQKTQEAAAVRKAAEEQQQRLQATEQARAAQFEKAVEAHALERQLKLYEALDWAALIDQDPLQAQKLDLAHRQLREQHWKVSQEMQAIVQQVQQKTVEERQQTLAKAQEQLAKEIKGWGPELAASITTTGKSYGFGDQELAQVADPRMVKVLHDAFKWQQLQQTKTLTAKKVADVKPVVVKTARTTQSAQTDARAQVARERLRKSGSSADAEDVLYERFMNNRKR